MRSFLKHFHNFWSTIYIFKNSFKPSVLSKFLELNFVSPLFDQSAPPARFFLHALHCHERANTAAPVQHLTPGLAKPPLVLSLRPCLVLGHARALLYTTPIPYRLPSSSLVVIAAGFSWFLMSFFIRLPYKPYPHHSLSPPLSAAPPPRRHCHTASGSHRRTASAPPCLDRVLW